MNRCVDNPILRFLSSIVSQYFFTLQKKNAPAQNVTGACEISDVQGALSD
jgi:hypothetical protein